jgi:hypothetical protein
MIILFTDEQFNNAKPYDLLPLQCEYCNNTFYKTKVVIQCVRSPKSHATGRFCCRKCSNLGLSTKLTVICLNCNKEFEKRLSQAIKFPNHFCCQSCAATYHNTHKTTGTRRSKLEIYLEEQIETYYPQLKCHYNKKDTIGSELDFYFPTLKLAIELNGIFHYEPIYGQDKLEKIQNNDEQKLIKCYELGIEFCIIDISSCKHLTQKQKDKYWDIVQSVIIKVLNRHVL